MGKRIFVNIKEIIVVEGKSDTIAVKRATGADTIETNGSAIDDEDTYPYSTCTRNAWRHRFYRSRLSWQKNSCHYRRTCPWREARIFR